MIVAAAIALAGCGSQPAKPAPAGSTSKATSAAPQVMSFGQERQGEHGTITVSKPTSFDLPADPARPKDLTRGAKFDIKIVNSTKTALNADAFAFSATVGSATAGLITDEKNRIGTKLQADILPSKDGQLTMALALPAKPSEVTVKIVFAKAKPLYWTGNI
ncbi:hypothetical protein [Kibdelosporangium aridum]|nr:hypothetical protein [Kibdelosporangium aridum]